MIRVFVFCLLAVSALAFGTPAAQSQNTDAAITLDADTLASWEQTARRAEEAIDAGRASTTAFEELRTQLVDWRSQFLAAQKVNESRIKTLTAQIAALGPLPEDGEEAPETASQRVELNTQLAQLRAPVKTAEVAYSQADGLIRAVDQIIRSRNTEALLELGPSPLNPANWKSGVDAAWATVDNIRKEFRNAWESEAQKTEFWQAMPEILAILVVSLVLLLLGRRWLEYLAQKVLVKKPTAGRWIVAFLLSIGQLLLPLIGVFGLAEAVYATEMVGVRGDIALSALILMGTLFLVARWLGGRVFPKSGNVTAPLNLTLRQRRFGRLISAALGFLLGLNALILVLARFDNWGEEALVVVTFPILLLVAFGQFQLAKLMLAHVLNDRDAGGAGNNRDRILFILSRILVLLALAGPALAAAGFFKAAQAIVYPTVMTLALLAILMVLQRVISEIYALVVGSEERAREALVPVLINFVIVLASGPFFALIWGARVTDLTELWARFQQGFALGDNRISPSDFLTFAIIFAIGYALTRLIQGTLRATVLPKTKLDAGGRNAIVSGVGYIGILVAARVAVSSAGMDLSSLAIVAGALSLGIGFGLQNIVSNFVAGIILLIERPISEGDWIEVGGQHGVVRDISVRSTRIETFDRTDVIVPNSDFVSGTVTNYTRGNTVGRVKVPVGVAYGTDTRLVETILGEIAKAHPMVLTNPGPAVVFQGFGADSLDFEIRAILRDVNWITSVRSDINHEIARRFGEEGIEIPFAQRDVWLRNPEVLNPKGNKTDE